MTRMCWSKGPKTSMNGVDTFELKKGGELLAILQQDKNKGDLWFSYGMAGRMWNTCQCPKPFMEAKDEATKLAKQHKADA